MADRTDKIFVALSGGVDSSVVAALLLKGGFDCAGVFMITCDQAGNAQANAEKVADKLGIVLYVLDLRRDFEQILNYFCSEYKKGRTPNPCVFCNRYIKFGKLWEFAQGKGANSLATGHYARIIKQQNNTCLCEAADTTKDQSYALAMINKDTLPHIVLPMGDYSKNQVRKIAAKLNLGTESQPESQEICFIPNNDWVAVLEQRCPELVRKGNIVNSSGKVLGEHTGVHQFTIGQRRGLKVAMGEPYYVVKIDAASNTVTLGPKEEVMHRKLAARDVNWLTEKPTSAFRARVKIRYNDKGNRATVIPQNDSVIVEFDYAVSAITPGQLAVFYVPDDKDYKVVGGGWINNISD